MDIDKIKTGDVLLVATDSWLGRTIRKVTHSEWSHTGVFVWLWGELFVIEAEKRGIQLTRWADKKYNNGKPKGRKLKYLTPNKPVNEQKIARFMLPYVGVTPYDYFGLIQQLVYQTTGRWPGRKREDKRFYCSEFEAFTYHNMDPSYYPKWWEISPGQVHTAKFSEY